MVDNVKLELKGITRTFGKNTAVDNLSLAFFPGEVLGLLGPNGAGKTTTINLIAGLLKPDSGNILIDGIPIDDHVPDYRQYRFWRHGRGASGVPAPV